MNEIIWIIVLLLLSPLSVVCENSSSVEWTGKSGFCGTELYASLKSKIHNEDMNQCRGLSYSKLYEDRVTDAPFAVSSSNPDDSKLNYGLIAINKTGFWSPVNKCCNLTLNKACQLRPTFPGEHLTLFATNGEAFCFNSIGEHSAAKSPWCDVVNQHPCLFYDNGTVIKRKTFEDVSTTHYKPPMRYCFVEVSAKVVLGNVSEDGMIHNVPGIKMHEDKVETESGVVPCDMKMNVKNYNQYLRDREIKPHNAICFFSQELGGGVWSPPLCKKSNLTLDNVVGEAWKIILVVLSVLISVVIVLIILRYKIWKYIPSYHDTEKDISNYMPRIEENEEFLKKNSDNNPDFAANELPDEIFAIELTVKKDEDGLADEAFDENVVKNKKNENSHVEKEQKHHMESANGVEVINECSHNFDYCAKEDVPWQRGDISRPETEPQLVSSSVENPDFAAKELPDEILPYELTDSQDEAGLDVEAFDEDEEKEQKEAISDYCAKEDVPWESSTYRSDML